MSTTALQVFRPAPFPRLRLAIPLTEGQVSAGFPSPADDYQESDIDLNEFLIRNPPATFIIRARGKSMIHAPINDGDYMIVDRSLTARNNDIVLAVVDNGLTVKTLRISGDRAWLQPENPAFPNIELNEEQDCQVWGVVVGCMRKFSRG